MRKTVFVLARRRRPALAAAVGVAASVALHLLVLRAGGLAMRHVPPEVPPAVIVASLPSPPAPPPDSTPPDRTLQGPVPAPDATPAPGPKRATKASMQPLPEPVHRPPPGPLSQRALPAAERPAPASAATAAGRGIAAEADRAAERSGPQPEAQVPQPLHPPVALAEPADPAESTEASGAAGIDEAAGTAEPGKPAATLPEDAPDTATAALTPPPESIELRFDAYLESPGGDTRIGDARFRLQAAEGRYRMVLEARGPLARFAYASSGLLGAQGFRPHRFSESRRVAFRARVERAVTFVTPAAPGAPPADGPPSVVAPAEPPDDVAGQATALQVPLGTQDRLSVLFQLWLMTRDHPERLVAGHEIVLPLASMKDHERATFRVGPVEPFMIEASPVEAVRLTRVSDRSRASGIEVWLAARAPHLPVGLRYVERDRAVRFVATGSG